MTKVPVTNLEVKLLASIAHRAVAIFIIISKMGAARADNYWTQDFGAK